MALRGISFYCAKYHFRVGILPGKAAILDPSWDSPSGRIAARVRATGFKGKATNIRLPANTCPFSKMPFFNLPSGCWQEALGPRGGCKGEMERPALLASSELSFLTF